MTTIRVHGILAKEYGEYFVSDLVRPREALDAIDVNREGFINRVIDLARQGIHYGLVVDGEHLDNNGMNVKRSFDSVDLVPVVIGAGFVGAVITLVGQALAAVATSSFGLQFALTAASLFISTLLQPTPKLPQPKAAVPGATQSFIFSNKANLAKQGIPVPVGYGRLRIGSAVVESTIKSFPQTRDVIETFAVAVGGAGAEDYYVLSDNENSIYAFNESNQAINAATDVIGELVVRGGGVDIPTVYEEAAMSRFVVKGIEEDWWDKVKHMYTFTWGNSGMSAVDWKRPSNSSGYWSGNVDTGKLGYISGGGATGFTDCFVTSHSLSGLWDEGMDNNNCFLAIAASDCSPDVDSRSKPLGGGVWNNTIGPADYTRDSGVFMINAIDLGAPSQWVEFYPGIRRAGTNYRNGGLLLGLAPYSGVFIGNSTGSGPNMDVSVLINSGVGISYSETSPSTGDRWYGFQDNDVTFAGGFWKERNSGSYSVAAFGTALTPEEMTGLSIALYDLCVDLGVPNFA